MLPKIGSGERPYTVPAVVYRLDKSGEFSVVSPDSTAVAADQDAMDAALDELKNKRDGLSIMPRYGLAAMKRTYGDGIYFSFVDAAVFDMWKSLAFRLAFAGLAILGVLLILNLFFARWALRPVEQAWTAQRRFIADASHELKTPLTVILANASILAKHPEKTLEEQMQWVEETQEEALRMQELVADMLSLAQAESAESFERSRVDMSALVSKEVLQFESVAFERHVTIADKTDEGIFVEGDTRKLEKLVGTLVDNACKYAQEDSIVTVQLATEGRKAVLAVRNMGNPIPVEDIDHVFDRFYRADAARTRDDSKSFGLGLAIAREIADPMEAPSRCAAPMPTARRSPSRFRSPNKRTVMRCARIRRIVFHEMRRGSGLHRAILLKRLEMPPAQRRGRIKKRMWPNLWPEKTVRLIRGGPFHLRDMFYKKRATSLPARPGQRQGGPAARDTGCRTRSQDRSCGRS